MEIRDGVHSVHLPYAAFEGENALTVHVLESESARIQFGAGHENTGEASASVARDLAVDVVIAEHGDGDHYGGFPAIRTMFEASGTEAPEFAVPEGDAEWVRNDGVEFDVTLKPGVEYHGVEPISVPGHTPGNMAYHFDDVLVAGDTVIGSDFEPVADDDWSGKLAIAPPSRNSGGDDFARESVRKLLDYEYETLLVTHGSSVLDDPHTEIERLLEDFKHGINRTEF